jgi:hypothetical protein
MTEPRLPEVGEYVRHHGTLVAIEEIPPPPQPPPQRDYIFEAITAECQLRLNGEVVKEIQEYNDFYGLNTSVESSIKEMKAFAAKKSIGPDSELEVVVIKVETQFRARPKETENFYDKTFFDFKYSRGLPDPKRTVIWSSKTF